MVNGAYTDIDNPELYFQTKLYTGTGSSNAITLDGSENMQPDWVWIKCRDDSHNHQVFDSVRGVHKRMRTDTNGAETSSTESLKSFDSDGFTLGTQANVNASASGDNSFVAWNWKKTATAGFDIVSYTGNGSNRTISHSLSAVPKMMIVKNRDATEEWTIYHAGNTSAPATDYLALNTNGATTDSNTRWNDTAPTSSVFTVGTSGVVNANGQKFIAYLFAEKQGYSKFGSYVGNNNANGNFIYTGFKPAFFFVKNATEAGYAWELFDNKRNATDGVGNIIKNRLFPDTSAVEGTNSDGYCDFVSNGVKIRKAGDSNSANTYIYWAIAENPFVTSGGVATTAR
tara:strand:- start:61 stop:1086 length:1026 start_codon:yes stop_codon:yes gene_type:complete